MKILNKLQTLLTKQEATMNELDIVKLVKPFKSLKVGTQGTIVLKYSDNDFEVEFFDENDESIDVVTISKKYLELVTKYSNQ